MLRSSKFWCVVVYSVCFAGALSLAAEYSNSHYRAQSLFSADTLRACNKLLTPFTGAKGE